MAVYSKHILSGSTNGRPFRLLGATTSGGTLVHTAVTATGADNCDEIWLWVTNTETTTGTITLRWGGTASSDQMIYSVPPQSGYICISPGFLLNGALVVRAFASASNQMNVQGYVNRSATA